MRMLSLVILVAACGGSKSDPSTPAAPKVWNAMDLEERTTYMKEVVLPQAKEIFVKFDPKKYESMDCVTCHGDGADSDFAMPNPKIKPLPASPEAFMAWIEKDAEAARYTQFMGGEVEPLMGKLLGKTVFDPKTGKGELNCAACHTLVDAEGNRVEMPKTHDH